MCRSDQSYSVQQLDDDVYSVPTEPTLASIKYCSVGPNYDMVTRERLDTYNVIDHGEQNLGSHVEVSDPTPVREETSNNGDDFYDAEEHTFSVVNKKKAKKTSEDGKGEREEPPGNDSAMAGGSLGTQISGTKT